MTPILPALPLLLVAALAVAPAAPATGPAPGAPGVDQQYLPAGKSGLLTSRTRESRVWATVQREGGLGEIFYPTIGGPSARSLTFAVASPGGGLARAAVRTEQLDGLRFRQTFAGARVAAHRRLHHRPGPVDGPGRPRVRGAARVRPVRDLRPGAGQLPGW